jgi:pyruvate,orthophosphate dikinase
MNSQKFVYFFGANESEGSKDQKNLLGGKGANLAEMGRIGIPVPAGFTITTEVCTQFYELGCKLPEDVKPQVLSALKKLESKMGKIFGDVKNPLLLSVRSGARSSMPGMMDTILNLGLNDQVVEGLAQASDNPRFAWDSYRRLIQMYSDVVMGINSSLLEVEIEDLKSDKGLLSDTDLSTEDLKGLAQKFKKIVSATVGRPFPEDPYDQLWGAIEAVFKSWNTPRAVTYRQLHHIPNNWGTAVNIQAMVFGNMGYDSATGVAFTRNPSTGEHQFFGEYLVNAQGEDVVAGIRTPEPIDKLKIEMPEAFAQLEAIYKTLEKHYKDMQDIEFTIEKGRLWMLQTRNGKRTARAALKIACDMMDEGLISKEEALLRLDPGVLDQLLHPTLDPKAKKELLAKGLPASPGGVSGQIVFSSEDAVAQKELGLNVILVRVETSPEDIAGMNAARGILTSRGGMTSHAAVVARGMGKCCVAGCGALEINAEAKTLKVKGYILKEGDVITLDGSTGEVFLGEVKTIAPELSGDFNRIMKLADEVRNLKVRTNADTPKDAKIARDFGAEGIGLCRTEHMFFGPDRIDVMRRMILSHTTEERKKALDELLPMQREDFYEILKIMKGYPVTIRLLDPPLHEFLPHSIQDMKDFALRVGLKFEDVKERVSSLHEFNPMLGHRGCRLAVTYPEIYQMQARAISQAAALIIKEGNHVIPEIMIPLIAMESELKMMRNLVEKEVKAVQSETNVTFEYQIGTMIELPRAAITADRIATQADFFSFGTNDLTQTTLGLSRDDSGRFLPHYVESGILERDPFMSIDQDGVGFLVKTGVDLGRKTRPKLKVGVCGEHGGDPQSIHFFTKVGLDYVSCSPFRVPIARLTAAQAALEAAK